MDALLPLLSSVLTALASRYKLTVMWVTQGLVLKVRQFYVPTVIAQQFVVDQALALLVSFDVQMELARQMRKFVPLIMAAREANLIVV